MKLRTTIFFLLLCQIVSAQVEFADKLFKRNGEVIVCQVREIGDDEIKYAVEGFREGLLFGVDKNKVERVLFADGRELNIVDSMFGKSNYDGQKLNALKINFLSPLMGATTFSYEHSLRPGRSVESGIGIIGLGNKTWDDKSRRGVFANVGYKFIKDPDYYLKGMRYAHVLKGSYFKPEMAVSVYNREYSSIEFIDNYNSRVDTKTENVVVFAFIW